MLGGCSGGFIYQLTQTTFLRYASEHLKKVLDRCDECRKASSAQVQPPLDSCSYELPGRSLELNQTSMQTISDQDTFKQASRRVSSSSMFSRV